MAESPSIFLLNVSGIKSVSKVFDRINPNPKSIGSQILNLTKYHASGTARTVPARLVAMNQKKVVTLYICIRN